MDLGIKIKRSKVVWRQVADQVRKKILSKQLVPGTKLPSTAQMASQIGTDVPTLHRALTELVCEGLITRTPRIGTHVAQWEKGLARLGIYHSHNAVVNSGTLFHRALEAEVQKAAAAMKISVQVWTDPRPHSKHGLALPVLEYAARERIIQGLISTDIDETHSKWLGKLSVPVVGIGDTSFSLINFDQENFFSVSLDVLLKQGCKSVALLCMCEGGSTLVQRFNDACQKRGVINHKEWMTGAPSRVKRRSAQSRLVINPSKSCGAKPIAPTALLFIPIFWRRV